MFDDLKSAGCIKKLSVPILTKDDIPYPASLIFNAGVAKFSGMYVMAFRNDYGTDKQGYESGKKFDGTSVGIAYSKNGVDSWRVKEMPLCDYKQNGTGEIKRLYDPRITVIDGCPYFCLAMDTAHGIRGCIAKADDNFEKLEIICRSVPDNRNMVLFPEKIGGYYCRLERPFPVYSRGHKDRFDIWGSKSPDIKFWGESALVLGVEDVPFSNDKIGPAAPPVKTEKGWLTVFHAVDIAERGKNGWENIWNKRYTAGIMLLDTEDPFKVIGMSKQPLITADREFENKDGFRQNVIFPGGMILEPDGEVKIYYGASDTVECLAQADVNDLLKLCEEQR